MLGIRPVCIIMTSAELRVCPYFVLAKFKFEFSLTAIWQENDYENSLILIKYRYWQDIDIALNIAQKLSSNVKIMFQ